MSVCKNTWNSSIKWNTSTQPSQYISILRKLALDIRSIFDYCELPKDTYDCWEVLSEMITEHGLCYTYNSKSSSEIYRDIM